MSIPKEPRQIMINIMYLVLTALLALNVSAEIFNAFKVVDEGLKQSNAALDYSNEGIPKTIAKSALAKPEFQTYADRVADVRSTSSDFTAYVQGLIDYMVDQSGDKDDIPFSPGDYVEFNGMKKLKGEKNKDITTRYLVNGTKTETPKGGELKDKILESRERFITFLDSTDQENAIFPLNIDDDTWRKSKKSNITSWEAFNFNHMPLQATLPILNKFINDAKATEADILNYLLKKVGGENEDVVLDEFIVISSPKKSYIIKGETYETELSLGSAASTKSGTKVTISVNGQPLNVRDGKATWSSKATGLGKKKYTAVATVFNPVKDETKRYTSEYEYEVGERSVSVSALQMNVFYIGVPNPVGVSAAGVPSNQVKVSMSGAGGCSIVKGGGNYVVTATRPTKPKEFAYVNVTAPGLSAKSEFRVKRIPDPKAKLGANDGGTLASGVFGAQRGVIAALENFDFDARCNIAGFTLVRVARRDDPETAVNRGGPFGADARRLVNQAKPGDRFFFENVRAKCPGDTGPTRKINELVFSIK